jgi:hypothetical protein
VAHQRRAPTIGGIVSARTIGALVALSGFFLLGVAETALADTGSWSAAAQWMPGRVVLGALGVAFAAILTHAQHS